jgi:hypothetical protein
MMPLVYFMALPSYVDRRRCLLLEKSLHYLCITIYVQSNIFTKAHVTSVILSLYKFIKSVVYNINGPVLKALVSKSDVQSSSHTRILISLPGISLLFIDPCIY